MRAAVLTADHTFEVVEVPDPAPAAGELVLRVAACGICGSDLKVHQQLPAGSVLGHEFCGEVVAVGGDAGRWREGDLVAAMPLTACGRCRWCLADDPAHCERVDYLGVGGTAGAFAELVRVAASSAVPLGEGVGAHGALVEPLAVGLHAVAAGGVGPGDRVLVLGGGNVGSAVSLWASRLGAGEVVVSDPSPARREAAAAFGATGVHDPGEGRPPSGFDVVVECVGAPGMLQAAIDAAAVRGRVVVAGVCMVPDTIVPLGAIMKEVQVGFAVYYRASEFGAAADLLRMGGVDTSAFVADEVALDGVAGAFTDLLAGRTTGKVLIRPQSVQPPRAWPRTSG